MGTACDQPPVGMEGEAPPSTPQANELPSLTLRDDTPNALLTWVDAQGDFHVARSPAGVPADSRERVRVVMSDRLAGTQSLVYVADLREKRSDGTYPVRTMPRSAWDEIGASKRKTRMEASAAQRPPSTATSSDAASTTPGGTVVVYGAEWCPACREAIRFLQKKGIRYLEKDVEESPAVQRELHAKLQRAGLPPTSSIPILDVGGKILVGFNPAVVERTLREAAETSRL